MRDSRSGHREFVERVATQYLERRAGTNDVGVAVLAQCEDQRWTPSTGQLIDVAKWNLLRYIPVKMRGAEDDKEETAKPFASL